MTVLAYHGESGDSQGTLIRSLILLLCGNYIAHCYKERDGLSQHILAFPLVFGFPSTFCDSISPQQKGQSRESKHNLTVACQLSFCSHSLTAAHLMITHFLMSLLSMHPLLFCILRKLKSAVDTRRVALLSSIKGGYWGRMDSQRELQRQEDSFLLFANSKISWHTVSRPPAVEIQGSHCIFFSHQKKKEKKQYEFTSLPL